MTRKGFALGLLISLVFATTMFGKPIELKKVYTYKFSQDSDRTPLKRPIDFTVTEEEIFLIPSFEQGRLVAYEKNNGYLEELKGASIGEFGDGPNGLIEPAFIHYSKRENRLLIWDHKLRKTFIYRREPRGFSFTREGEISCWYGATSMRLHKDQLFLAGYIKDKNSGKEYEYYSYDLLQETTINEYKINYLLSRSDKYFNTPPENFRNKYKNEGISALGITGFFDISYEGDKLFTVWEGDNRINVTNLSTGKIIKKFYSDKKYYKKPKLSTDLKNAYDKNDWKKYKKELGKFSKIRDFSVGRDHILLIFENRTTQENQSIYYLQFIDLNGKHLTAIPFQGKSDQMFYFDKDTSNLYTLTGNWEYDQNKKTEYLNIKEASKYQIK
jgi:hypothetical protein